MSNTLTQSGRDRDTERQSNSLKAVVALAAVGVLGAVIGTRYLWQGADQHGPMRWHNAQDPVEGSEHRIPSLAVYSSPNIAPPHALPTLRDLGDQAQVQAIAAMQTAGTRSHPWDDLRKALTDVPEPGETDPYLFERVLVATVGRGTEWMPGDRMVRTEIIVQPINFRFAAYTIAATDNESVKVSSVEATDTRKLSSDVGLAFPGLGEVKVDGLPGSESSIKATSDIKAQFEQLGIDIMPGRLSVIRESESGGDVVGNTRVALSMTTDAMKITDGANTHEQRDEIVLAVTGLNLDADRPTMDVVPLVPLPHCALKANVVATYIQRHILRGREFYDEAMHDVRFVKDRQEKTDVSIMGADDVAPFVWSIQLVPLDQQPDNAWGDGKWHALSALANGNGVTRRIVFSDYGRAVKMAHWVRTHAKEPLASTPTGQPPGDAGVYTFNYGKFLNEGKSFALAVIKQTGDECKEPTTGRPVREDESGAK